MKKAFAMLVLTSFSSMACYNTHIVPQEEFRKLQSRDAIPRDPKLRDKLTKEEISALENRGETESVLVSSVKGDKLTVGRESALYVRSQGGRRYPITPFNFSMVSSQLVASDRDTLLALDDLQSLEIDELSVG